MIFNSIPLNITFTLTLCVCLCHWTSPKKTQNRFSSKVLLAICFMPLERHSCYKHDTYALSKIQNHCPLYWESLTFLLFLCYLFCLAHINIQPHVPTILESRLGDHGPDIGHLHIKHPVSILVPQLPMYKLPMYKHTLLDYLVEGLFRACNNGMKVMLFYHKPATHSWV